MLQRRRNTWMSTVCNDLDQSQQQLGSFDGVPTLALGKLNC